MSNLRNTITAQQNSSPAKAPENASNPEQRLRQAAHILANGAIRAALKRRSRQADEQKKKTDPEANNQMKAQQPNAPQSQDDRLQASPATDVQKPDILSDCGSESHIIPPLPAAEIALAAPIRQL